MPTATALTVRHEHLVPHDGNMVLSDPWETLDSNADIAIQRVQNTTPEPISVDDGTSLGPLTLQPGETLFAWASATHRHVFRVPYSGVRFLTVDRAAAALGTAGIGSFSAEDTAVEVGHFIAAFRGVRGECSGEGVGTATATLAWTGDVPGLPTRGQATGVAQQPGGDAAGNVGVGIAGIITQAGTIRSLAAGGSTSGPCVSVQNLSSAAMVVCRTEPLSFATLNRIRSHVSEDAGSLFQATQAVAVESAVSEAFPYGTTLPAGVPHLFREALTPYEAALRHYPLPTRNQEMLLTVEGETNLGRMARTYPGSIVTRVADIPGHAGDTMTAQEAISYIFGRWAEEFPWFEFEPVPDLRLLVPEAVAAPRQHYIDHPEAGVLTVEAIAIPQEGDDRRTMRDLIDEWLSIFPGTIVRQNSSGRIELVPRVGPDAPDGPAVTLGWRDIISMSDGEDDPRGVVNHARVTSQGWTFEEDQALTPPLHVLGLRSDGLQESALEEVVDDLTSERLADGGAREFEMLAEPDKPLTIEWRFRAFTAGNPTSTNLTTEVDLNGSFQMQQTAELEVSWFIFGVDNEKTRVRFTRQGNGIRARFDQSGRWQFGPNPFAGIRYAAYVLEFSVAGTGWVRANEQIVGEFSSSNGDFLPDADDPGQNALEVSESLFGEREATIRSDVFQLTPEQAQAVAQGYVLFNINPRTIRDVQQSEWNRYPVRFDHIGRLVDLPNGERAVVENRSYSDSFAPDGGFMQSSFTATVTNLVIDTTTEFLHLDDGNFMRLDDGSLVEAS